MIVQFHQLSVKSVELPQGKIQTRAVVERRPGPHVLSGFSTMRCAWSRAQTAWLGTGGAKAAQGAYTESKGGQRHSGWARPDTTSYKAGRLRDSTPCHLGR